MLKGGGEGRWGVMPLRNIFNLCQWISDQFHKRVPCYKWSELIFVFPEASPHQRHSLSLSFQLNRKWCKLWAHAATSGEQGGSMWVTHGSKSSQKSPAEVWVSCANDPLSQRKSSDTCLYWPSSEDTNSGLQMPWGERVALSEPKLFKEFCLCICRWQWWQFI